MDVNVTQNILAEEAVNSENLQLLKSLQPKSSEEVNQSNLEFSLNYSATEESHLELVRGAEVNMYKLTQKGWKALEINRLQKQIEAARV